jgi:hypothetical protein
MERSAIRDNWILCDVASTGTLKSSLRVIDFVRRGNNDFSRGATAPDCASLHPGYDSAGIERLPPAFAFAGELAQDLRHESQIRPHAPPSASGRAGTSHIRP